MTLKERWRLTDEFVEKLKKGKVRVHGKMYRAVPDDRDFKVGDLVLDRADGAYGTIDIMHEGFVALRDGFAVEIGISLDQIIKLVEWKD